MIAVATKELVHIPGVGAAWADIFYEPTSGMTWQIAEEHTMFRYAWRPEAHEVPPYSEWRSWKEPTPPSSWRRRC